MLAIQEGRLTPTVWSPGESVWVEQLDKGWTGAKPAHSEACKPVVLTPVGLAMWQPMAEALGWPNFFLMTTAAALPALGAWKGTLTTSAQGLADALEKRSEAATSSIARSDSRRNA